jgi:hypothetical protein
MPGPVESAQWLLPHFPKSVREPLFVIFERAGSYCQMAKVFVDIIPFSVYIAACRFDFISTNGLL